MLPLAHMGIGRRLVGPWTEGLPAWPVYLGAILPDLIDKPVYHLGVFVTGRAGAALGVIAGTRTFGHTALLAFLVGLLGWRLRSNLLRALALGMASHLVLDTVADFVHTFQPDPEEDGFVGGVAAVFWPTLGWAFPPARLLTTRTYAAATLNLANIVFELVGAALLWRDWKATRKASVGAPPRKG